MKWTLLRQSLLYYESNVQSSSTIYLLHNSVKKYDKNLWVLKTSKIKSMFALLYKRQPGNKMSSHSYRHCLTKNSRITTYKVFLSLQLTSNARLIHSAEISSPHSKLTWAMIPYFHDLFTSIWTLANSLVLFSTTSLKYSWISILKQRSLLNPSWGLLFFPSTREHAVAALQELLR